MKKITFTPGNWENAGLQYAYSWRFPQLPVFRQEEDCIVNNEAPGTQQVYDYMGLLDQELYTYGTKLSARLSFHKYGAPMLTICDRYETDENGVLRTLDYYELVIWENGLNVWRMHTQDRKVSWYKVLGDKFSLAAKEIHTISVLIKENRLIIQVNDKESDLFVHDLGEKFLLGFTACEGFCRTYDMTIESGEL